MSEWWNTLSYESATALLEEIGFKIHLASFPMKNIFHPLNSEIFITNPIPLTSIDFDPKEKRGFMSLEKQGNKRGSMDTRQHFLNLFENRGWQPSLGAISPHGPRAGSVGQIDSIGSPVSTIWELRPEVAQSKKLSKELKKIYEAGNTIFNEAEIMAELGKGGNDEIYIWSGYMAFYPSGYSNMILIEWYEDTQLLEGGSEEITGRVHFGEAAFEKLKELRSRPFETPFYQSINRWDIV